MTKPNKVRPAQYVSRHLNLLIYGLNGRGKSPIAGTSEKALVLECGRGETDSMVANGASVDVWKIANRSDLQEAYEYCRHEGYNDYAWVWIDSLSGFEKLYMREELDVAIDKRKQRNQNADPVADRREYLLVQTAVKQYTQDFADLPMHFGATATVMIKTWMDFDEEGNERETQMMMPQIQGREGEVAQAICGEFNVIGYLDRLQVGESNKTIPGLLLRDDGRHIARDRFMAVPVNEAGWLLNPTIPKIQGAIENRLAQAKVARPKKPLGKSTKRTTKATKRS